MGRKNIIFAPIILRIIHKNIQIWQFREMRVKMGVFISVVIAIALLAFIETWRLQNVISMFSRYDVGEVNGKGISSQPFQKRRLDYFQKIYQMTTGQTGSDEKLLR